MMNTMDMDIIDARRGTGAKKVAVLILTKYLLLPLAEWSEKGERASMF